MAKNSPRNRQSDDTNPNAFSKPKGASYEVKNGDGTAYVVRLQGRQLWTLHMLIQGPCNPRNHPAPRWSSYVAELRKKGLMILTEWEHHGAPFPGRHGVYRLISHVKPIMTIREGKKEG